MLLIIIPAIILIIFSVLYCCLNRYMDVDILLAIAIGAAVLLIFNGTLAFINNVDAKADYEAALITRESLVYQLENEIYISEDPDASLIAQKQLYNEITEFNKSIARNKIAQNNLFLNIYVPKILTQIEPIEFPDKTATN